MPKLSIITINFNNLEGLQKTMESVFAQTLTDYEYIIIDGGSTDGSKELIKKQENKLVYWVSEKDKGIYNAMNKGIEKSGGEYLLFLNSGDYLKEKNSIGNLFSLSSGEDLVYGDLLFFKDIQKKECKFPDKLSFDYFLQGFNSLPHAATLIKRSLFQKVGIYTESFSIVSDWEFFLLAINKFNCTYKHVPHIIAEYDLEGISSQEKNDGVIENERKIVLQKYFPTFLPDYNRLHSQDSQLIVIKKMFGYRLHKKALSVFKKKNDNIIHQPKR